MVRGVFGFLCRYSHGVHSFTESGSGRCRKRREHESTREALGCACVGERAGARMTLLGSAVSVSFASVAVALTRRHGVVTIQTARIQTPMLRQATNLFLSFGDTMVAFAEKQGVPVNKYIGNAEDTKKK